MPSRTACPSSDRRRTAVHSSPIRWIEAHDRLVFAYLTDTKYRTDFTLDELEQRLDERFVRIPRSTPVNLRDLMPGTYRIRLDDGTTLPVARRRASDVKTVLGG